MRRLYATRSMPRSAPKLRNASGASTHRSAGMRKSRCGVCGSSTVVQSRSVGGRASAGIGGTCHPRAVTLEADLQAVVQDRPGTFGIYARNLGTGETVGLHADRVMNTESAAKTFILLHYSGLVTAGSLDPASRIELT